MLKLKLQYFGPSCEELTHWKRLWCWEGLGAGGEGDDRGWDGWMASRTRWTWVLVNSGSWWWTGRPGVLQFMGLQRVRHDWSTELNDSEWLPTIHDCKEWSRFRHKLLKKQWYKKGLHQRLWLCGSQQTVENSERDGNTRSPDLPLEKSLCGSGSNS